MLLLCFYPLFLRVYSVTVQSPTVQSPYIAHEIASHLQDLHTFKESQDDLEDAKLLHYYLYYYYVITCICVV